MLVVARRPGEAVQIGEGITVYVVAIRGKQVRLGIDAPANMAVRRSEIRRRVWDPNLQAVDVPRDRSETITPEGERQTDRRKTEQK